MTPARRWIDRGLLWSAWAGIAPIAALAFARLAAPDAHPVLLAVSFTTWTLAPAWLALAFAIARRHPELTIVSALVALVHAWCTLPGLIAEKQAPATGAALRIVTANLRVDNPLVEQLALELARELPDLLVVQELDAPGVVALEKTVGATHAYRHLVPRADPFGIGIFSRFPIAEATTLDLGGFPMIRARIVVGESALTLFGVHAHAPLPRDRARLWEAQMGLLAERLDAQSGAVVLAGDLNATSHHDTYRALLRARGGGYHAAHEALGRGLAVTWPNGIRRYPPIRIDHVLATRDVVFVGVREGQGIGSDHRPVIVDLALPR